MSNLRDEIAEIIQTTDEPWLAADDIMTAVREALLSNEVQAPIRHELHHYPRTSTRDTVKTVIEMALDAVTGEDDER